MTDKQEFDLAHAQEVALKLYTVGGISLLSSDYFCVCGSIRRGKPKVHDVDIVLVPKDGLIFKNKIIEGTYEGIPFQIYLATDETFECLKLIRTGSADHNKMLCSIAKSKGWKLHADGQGLEVHYGTELTEWVTKEQEILEKLLGKYVEPKDRETPTEQAQRRLL